MAPSKLTPGNGGGLAVDQLREAYELEPFAVRFRAQRMRRLPPESFQPLVHVVEQGPEDRRSECLATLQLRKPRVGRHADLGGAKIRKDRALLGNFGISSQAGPYDPEEKAIVAELERLRGTQRLAHGLADAPDVAGPGSILSDRTWTPLLNDAFILGGAHAGHEFHLVEDAVDNYFNFRKTRALLEPDRATTTEKWMGFFKAHPELLWDQKLGNPRVLARELIGLKTCGYKPQFFPVQLSFAKTSSGHPTFKSYLNALAAANCRPGQSAELLRYISRFLFDRDDAFVHQGLSKAHQPA